MAVEARHMDLFPSQLITNRDFIVKQNQPNPNMYVPTQMDSGLVFNETMPDSSFLPLYQSLVSDPLMAKASVNTNQDDSGLTYNVTAPRKRSRDQLNDFEAFTSAPRKTNKVSGSFEPFLDDDVMLQIQQQQSEMDRFIVDYTQKVRMEVEERRKRQSRMLVSAVQESVIKKLKEKDDEIQRMGKLNWVLQERVKSLYVENQIWRDLAQTNEATANSLRTNLEQVLAHVSEERHASGCGAGTLADDAESSCGSSGDGGWTLAEEEVVKENKRMCKSCGERESSVLLLPCRHLCLCTLCGSTLLGTCPVCDSVMKGSVHVNMS